MDNDPYIARPGWVVASPHTDVVYCIGKGYTFREAAEFAHDLIDGARLRVATEDELRRRQRFLDAVKAASS